MNWQALQSAGERHEVAEQLLRAICPHEFADRPLYVVPTTYLDIRQVPAGISGATGLLMDLELQPTFERQGVWRGRGPAMMINGDIIDVNHFCDIALHEFAHVIECLDSPLVTQTFEQLDEVFKPYACAETVAQKRRGQAPVAAPVPWERHGKTFIRTTLHLIDRARRLGFDADVDRVGVAGAAYGLSPAAKYQAALADELEHSQQLPLTSVIQSPAPTPFVQLFQADTALFQTCKEK